MGGNDVLPLEGVFPVAQQLDNRAGSQKIVKPIGIEQCRLRGRTEAAVLGIFRIFFRIGGAGRIGKIDLGDIGAGCRLILDVVKQAAVQLVFVGTADDHTAGERRAGLVGQFLQ